MSTLIESFLADVQAEDLAAALKASRMVPVKAGPSDTVSFYSQSMIHFICPVPSALCNYKPSFMENIQCFCSTLT